MSAPKERDTVFLAVAAAEQPSAEDVFLVSVVADLCGTVISKLQSIANERASTAQMASLNDKLEMANAKLEATVVALTKSMETHRKLNEVAASNQGEAGIAEALHRLTGLPVLIQDVHGNLRATAGNIRTEFLGKDSPEGRRQLIHTLAAEQRVLYRSGTWLALANPRVDVFGIIALVDPERSANESDVAALQYAATVLSVELGRLQSIAEAELRSQSDFAEALLEGADESVVKASAHNLLYDAQRPHRVIIATGRSRHTQDTDFFRAVHRQVRRFDVGLLMVTRPDSAIIIAYNDLEWSALQSAISNDLHDDLHGGSCRLAVGSRYPNAWDIPRSYREAQFVANLASSMNDSASDAALQFESLGIYRLLSSVTDLHEVEGFMRAQIGSLIEYDEKHHSSMVGTLACYLDSAQSHQATADSLFIHRNTVKYRIRRIREILGYDISDGKARFELHLATRIWTTLETLRQTSPV